LSGTDLPDADGRYRRGGGPPGRAHSPQRRAATWVAKPRAIGGGCTRPPRVRMNHSSPARPKKRATRRAALAQRRKFLHPKEAAGHARPPW